ncbi:twin-arginine translocase TatA/TatE family subunit [Microbacterium aurantiacum]|uniref:twin-arginine translocase TatA/TatE family subunit n=1 Tax=Microbacterium aurantiacum TaxID=162393 RepID=UPI000C80E7BC|nr:twin-arginine translocase TatA/TatE family subunit [Microbacterium aurantiacum]
MTFGLTFEKLLLIGLIAVMIIGPERLPRVAENFSKFVRRAGVFLRDTKSKVREEMGPEIDDVDWRKLDPRQYDPRRIIRDALLEEDPKPATPAAAIAEPVPEPLSPRRSQVSPAFTGGNPPPFDVEAT